MKIDDIPYLLAELERSLFDLARIPKENRIGRKQMQAHIHNVEKKLKYLKASKRAYKIKRKYA